MKLNTWFSDGLEFHTLDQVKTTVEKAIATEREACAKIADKLGAAYVAMTIRAAPRS